MDLAAAYETVIFDISASSGAAPYDFDTQQKYLYDVRTLLHNLLAPDISINTDALDEHLSKAVTLLDRLATLAELNHDIDEAKRMRSASVTLLESVIQKETFNTAPEKIKRFWYKSAGNSYRTLAEHNKTDNIMYITYLHSAAHRAYLAHSVHAQNNIKTLLNTLSILYVRENLTTQPAPDIFLSTFNIGKTILTLSDIDPQDLTQKLCSQLSDVKKIIELFEPKLSGKVARIDYSWRII